MSIASSVVISSSVSGVSRDCETNRSASAFAVGERRAGAVAEEVASQPSLKGMPVWAAQRSCQERGAAPKRPLGTAPSLGPVTAVGMPPAGHATPEAHTGADGAYASGSFGMAHTA
eukprot:CAMPEP_0118848634 /NCGR_PEP_ID=MMETSP1162-20130426/93565_1 /TAXON_ID=33656 /ORGANISM="Phaeocystis Sp, Strain CCMP2710" /LENGTH=115 /DNA_ID=CAMNT_0006780823 /DNA_START=76 /DNA_END=424 /DNA_ORIENTATION=-